MGKPNLDKQKNKRRAQKYGQKSKIEAWQDRRKEYIRHEYRKVQNRMKGVKFDVKKIYEEEDNFQQGVKNFKNSDERVREKDEREKRREEFLKRKAEKEEAVKKSQKERMERNRKLNKKTKKGQPVMKGRMEYLLEKIQKSMQS